MRKALQKVVGRVVAKTLTVRGAKTLTAMIAGIKKVVEIMAGSPAVGAVVDQPAES